MNEITEQQLANDFSEYIRRCQLVMRKMFSAYSESDNLQEWLNGIAPDRRLQHALLHAEPLYTVSSFLGIDEGTPDFERTVQEYTIFVQAQGWDHQTAKPVLDPYSQQMWEMLEDIHARIELPEKMDEAVVALLWGDNPERED